MEREESQDDTGSGIITHNALAKICQINMIQSKIVQIVSGLVHQLRIKMEQMRLTVLN